jgi:hypothetical protein
MIVRFGLWLLPDKVILQALQLVVSQSGQARRPGRSSRAFWSGKSAFWRSWRFAAGRARLRFRVTRNRS